MNNKDEELIKYQKDKEKEHQEYLKTLVLLLLPIFIIGLAGYIASKLYNINMDVIEKVVITASIAVLIAASLNKNIRRNERNNVKVVGKYVTHNIGTRLLDNEYEKCIYVTYRYVYQKNSYDKTVDYPMTYLPYITKDVNLYIDPKDPIDSYIKGAEAKDFIFSIGKIFIEAIIILVLYYVVKLFLK